MPIRIAAVALVALSLVCAVGARAADPPGTAAQWIDRANEALLPDDSMKARAVVTTRDGYGGQTREVLEVTRAAGKDATRTLIEVVEPEVGRGVVYQIVAPPDQPLERWVWLPALRRLRMVSGVQRTDHFLGTEFTYEDLGLALPVERREGSVTWRGTGDDRVVEVESRPYHYYSRVVTQIDPDTHLPVAVFFYDRADQLFREQRFGFVHEVEGHAFPMQIEVRDTLTGAASVLRFESVDFGADVPAGFFEESIIRKRLSAAAKLSSSPPEADDE